MAKKKTKRKKSSAPVVRLSPTKYIKTKARHLPIHECHITDGWEDSGLATVIVTRRQPSGNLIIGTYLVDTFCLGVKSVFYQYNATSWDYEELLERARFAQAMVPCDYVLAHNVVYGAIAFAEDLGFSPHKDFESVAQYILEEDTDDVEFIDLEFGRNGEPVLFVNHGVNPTRYIKQLKQSVGEGNYQVIYRGEVWDDEDYDENDLPAMDTERPFRHLVERRLEEVQAAARSSEDMEISLDRLNISYEPLDSEYVPYGAGELPIAEDLLRDLHVRVEEDPEAMIPELRQYTEQYPRHPIFRSLLVHTLDEGEQEEAADREARRLHEDFPEYLPARISYADRLLLADRVEEAFELFDQQCALDRVYPGRTSFHYTEVLSYYAFLSRYLTIQGERERALFYYQAMCTIDADHHQTRVTESLIGSELAMEKIGKLLEDTSLEQEQGKGNLYK